MGITIALGLVREDGLGVTLGSKGTAFQERFAVPNASVVDVESCLDVVDGVNDAVLRVPEVVIEDWLVLEVDAVQLGFYVEVFVHIQHRSRCALALAVFDIAPAEQELSIQV